MILMDVRGSVAQTNAEIRAAEAAHQWRKGERERLQRRTLLIDALINDLEMLNLRKVSRVPLAYEPRLLQLRATLGDTVSTEVLDKLRTRVRPVKLMDCLYTIQEALFVQKHPEVPREGDGHDFSGLYPAA
jgi:hypothetical protein